MAARTRGQASTTDQRGAAAAGAGSTDSAAGTTGSTDSAAGGTGSTDSAAGGTGSTDVGDELPAQLRITVGRLGRRLQHTRAGAGLTPTEAVVVATAARRGPVGLSRLAAAEGLNPTMLSRVVQRLEGQGLLRRRVDPADRRAATVELTAAGRRLHQRIRTERTGTLRVLVDALDPGQRAALAAALPVLAQLADGLCDADGTDRRSGGGTRP